MRKFQKIIIGFFFSLFFLIFVVLSSLNFFILNDKYLFYVFGKHNLYERVPKELAPAFINDPNLSREERLGYSLIIRNISPQTVEKIIKTNFTNVLSFVHGKNSDILIYFPAKELKLGPQDINWSYSENTSPNTNGSVSNIKGIWIKLFFLWIVILLFLVGLFLLYGKVALDKLAGRRLLVINGTILYIFSSFLFVAPQILAQTFPDRLEPSQVIIKILFSTLIPEVAFTWIILGIVVFIAGLILVFLERRRIKNSVIIAP